jgi:hypothetical protein
MPLQWSLGYPRYMIDDGCPHIEAGQMLEWSALEFTPQNNLVVTKSDSKNAIEIADHRYMITAEVVYISDTASVIDFGLKAIRTRDLLPPECKEGDFVSGEIYLSLPLCWEVVPDRVTALLAYKWSVQKVLADLTPFTEIRGAGFIRDRSRVRYQEVRSTEVLEAESYVLRCREELRS